MLKILIAFGISVVLAFIVITSWFLFFGYHGLPGLGPDFISLTSNVIYWLGAGIFSILFFVFFALPIALMLIRDSMSTA